MLKKLVDQNVSKTEMSERNDCSKHPQIHIFDDLHYFHFPATRQTEYTLLYFHGAGSTLSICFNELNNLYTKVCETIEIIALEYPGYVASDKKIPNESSLSSFYVQQQLPRLHNILNWNWAQTIVIGKCLGAFIACHVAFKYPMIYRLFLTSAFPSIRHIVKDKWNFLSYMVPSLYVLPWEQLQKLPCPVLFVHGCHDSLCSMAQIVDIVKELPTGHVVCLHGNTHIQNIDVIWPVIDRLIHDCNFHKYIHVQQGFNS